MASKAKSVSGPHDEAVSGLKSDTVRGPIPATLERAAPVSLRKTETIKETKEIKEVQKVLSVAIKNNDIAEVFQIVNGRQREIPQTVFQQMIMQSGSHLMMAAYTVRAIDQDVTPFLNLLLEKIDKGTLESRAREFLAKAPVETEATAVLKSRMVTKWLDNSEPVRMIAIIDQDTSIRDLAVRAELELGKPESERHSSHQSAAVQLVIARKKHLNEHLLLLAQYTMRPELWAELSKPGQNPDVYQALLKNRSIPENLRNSLSAIGLGKIIRLSRKR